MCLPWPRPRDALKVRKQSTQTNKNSQIKFSFECWDDDLSRGQLFLGETKLLSGQGGREGEKIHRVQNWAIQHGWWQFKGHLSIIKRGRLGGLQKGQTFGLETQPKSGVIEDSSGQCRTERLLRLPQKNALWEKYSGDHEGDENDQGNPCTFIMRQQGPLTKVSKHGADHRGNTWTLCNLFDNRWPRQNAQVEP